jgi:hypothetical protein
MSLFLYCSGVCCIISVLLMLVGGPPLDVWALNQYLFALVFVGLPLSLEISSITECVAIKEYIYTGKVEPTK